MHNDKPLTAASDNLLMWRMGEACRKAAEGTAGDYIDRGLILLRELNAAGFDVVQRTPGVPAAGPKRYLLIDGKMQEDEHGNWQTAPGVTEVPRG